MHKFHTPDAAHAASLVVEKTDDLISALSLVRTVFAAGNVAANAPAAIDPEPTSDEQAAPGLLRLLKLYQAGCQEFAAATADQMESGAFVSSTYGRHYEALAAWHGPAATRAEAMEALLVAEKESSNGDTELPFPLIRAARQFFEQELRFVVLDRTQSWPLGDAAAEIGAMIVLMEHSLSKLSEQMVGNPDIKYVAALQNALRLMQRRNDFLEDELHEIACRFNERAN